VALRLNGVSILAALALTAAALGAGLAGPFGEHGRLGPAGAASATGPANVASAAGTPLPLLKGEMGDFSYFDGPKPVPPIEFEDGEGKALTLAQFRGRVVLVNFWATWCAPCVREMPSLDRLQATLGGKDFVVLDLSLDRQGAAAILPYFEANKLTHLGVYLDPEGKSFHAWHGSGVPMSFLIGRDGRARGALLGAADWDSPDALALIRHFIAEGAAAKPEETRAETAARAS